MKTVLPQYSLKKNGYRDMKPGKTLPLYCKTCGHQSTHRCTGSKKDGEAVLYRFECIACKNKLDGGN